jgi:Cu/Ag efflux protein CusF
MKRFGLGSVAGLGVAGLLVAGTAYAQSGSTAGGQTTDPSQSGSKMGSGTGSTTSQGTGSTGSSSSTTGTGSPGTAEQHAMGKEGGKNELTGTVEKFDRESKELTLQHSDKKLKVNDSTRVMKDGQRGSLSDIKEGDQVRASFSGTGATLTATRIDVVTAGSMGTGSTGSTGSPGGTGSTAPSSTPPPSGTTPPPSGTTPPPSKGY